MRLLFQDTLSESERYDLLVGFLVGLLYEGPAERYTGEQSSPSSVEIMKNIEARLQSWKVLDDLKSQSGRKIQLNLRMRRNIVCISSESAGLTVSPVLTEYLLEEAYVPSLDINQTDKKRTRFQREVEKLISELIEESNIGRIEELIDCITDSLKLFHKMDTTLSVFRYVYSSEDEVTSADFSHKKSSDSMHQIRIMAGEYKYSESWRETPLIKSTNQAWAKDTWSLTAFGELVGYIDSQEKDPSWLHQKVLCEEQLSDDENELIQNALSELGI